MGLKGQILVLFRKSSDESFLARLLKSNLLPHLSSCHPQLLSSHGCPFSLPRRPPLPLCCDKTALGEGGESCRWALPFLIRGTLCPLCTCPCLGPSRPGVPLPPPTFHPAPPALSHTGVLAGTLIRTTNRGNILDAKLTVTHLLSLLSGS